MAESFSFIATFTAAVAGYDAWFYIVHRLLHVPCLYRRFHFQHHTFKHPTFNEAFYASVTENAVSGLGIAAPIVLNKVNNTSISMAGFAAAWLFCFLRGVLRHDARAAWIVGRHHLQHHIDPSCNFSSWYIDAVLGTASKSA